MKQPNKFLFLLPCAALILSGCATSQTPRLYVAAPLAGWRTVATRDALHSKLTVRFAPVRLASYLDRPQIVSRISDHEIKVDSFNRWGIPLDVLSTELLAESVARAIPEAFVETSAQRTMKEPGYLVQVEIVRLDGALGGPVELVAQWSMAKSKAENVPIIRQLDRCAHETKDKSYEAYVDAIRQNVADLGADIAKAIQSDRSTR